MPDKGLQPWSLQLQPLPSLWCQSLDSWWLPLQPQHPWDLKSQESQGNSDAKKLFQRRKKWAKK